MKKQLLFLDKQYVLASKSPRRIDLLQRLIPYFEVDPSCVIEVIPPNETPENAACLLAKQKAQDVSSRHPNKVILGFDTIVVIGNKILGKPQNESDAKNMLKALSGKKHRVITGCAVVYGNSTDTFYGEATVCFSKLSEEEIKAYIDTEEPFDKAGAYGIQGFGARYITSIEGDYYSVMGLPISKLYRYLRGLI
jgi:septum formation protein